MPTVVAITPCECVGNCDKRESRDQDQFPQGALLRGTCQEAINPPTDRPGTLLLQGFKSVFSIGYRRSAAARIVGAMGVWSAWVVGCPSKAHFFRRRRKRVNSHGETNCCENVFFSR
jgi:hypothetical protein